MIDILMAVCNGEKFVKEQIDSILTQTYENWRLIIHDDGSVDKTVEIIKEYEKKYPEKIKVISDGIKTGGAKYNFFHLMKLSNAEYIMLSDQDDVWEKKKVEKAYRTIKNIEKRYGKDMPILCHSDLRVVDSKLNVINESFFDMQKLDKRKNRLSDILVQNNITGCTAIMNKKVVEICHSMPDQAIMHDWWLGLIVAAFGIVYFMKNSEINYRQHEHNTEGAKDLNSPKYLLKKLLNREQIKESLNRTYTQADKFYDEYKDKLSAENREIIEGFLSIRKSNKLQKLGLIKKYGFMKSGLVRKISFVFFI